MILYDTSLMWVAYWANLLPITNHNVFAGWTCLWVDGQELTLDKVDVFDGYRFKQNKSHTHPSWHDTGQIVYISVMWFFNFRGPKCLSTLKNFNAVIVCSLKMTCLLSPLVVLRLTKIERKWWRGSILFNATCCLEPFGRYASLKV